MPLYSGTSELSQPFPNIGIAVGYGNTGGGLGGEVRFTTGTKRGGLVLLDGSATVSDQLVLTSHFQDRGALFTQGLPSTFLEGAVSGGDSGGGLFQSIGPGGTLVQTGIITSFGPNLLGKNAYGAEDRFTEISPFASWIQSAALDFGAVVPSAIGTTPDEPLVPVERIATGSMTTNAYIFGALAGVPEYIDPSGSVIEYKEAFGPLMTAVYLPTGDVAELWLFDASEGKFVESGDVVDGGTWFRFGGAGLRDFELSGLPGGEFVTGLTFAGDGQVGLDLIAGSSSLASAPEPSTWAMLLIGFAGLGFAGYRKARKPRTASTAA